MEIGLFQDASSASLYAADIVGALISFKPNAVLGLASGGTPIKLYQELVKRHKVEGLDFSSVTVFILDEYLGLGKENLNSFYSYYNENLFSHTNLNRSRIHVLDGKIEDVKEHCKAYEEEIRKAGGIDLQILGIGSNGHIGFNEPTSSLVSRTRIKTLTRQTCLDNVASFGSLTEVPQHAITMGIGTIMECRACMLLAFGGSKSSIVAKAVEGPISAMIPASILQMHPCVQVLLDQGAATDLEMKEYYEHQVQNFKENMLLRMRA